MRADCGVANQTLTCSSMSALFWDLGHVPLAKPFRRTRYPLTYYLLLPFKLAPLALRLRQTQPSFMYRTERRSHEQVFIGEKRGSR